MEIVWKLCADLAQAALLCLPEHIGKFFCADLADDGNLLRHH